MPGSNNFCRLGGLTFSAFDGITGFENESGYDYAVINKATGKPGLQAIGENLSRVVIEIKLRNFAGHNVAGQMALIEAMRATGDPQILVFASGVYQGQYVIEAVKTKLIKTDRLGLVTQANLSIQLLEFNEDTVTSIRNTESRSSSQQSTRTVTEETF